MRYLLGFLSVALIVIGLWGRNREIVPQLRVWTTEEEYFLLQDVNPIFEERFGVEVIVEAVHGKQVPAMLPIFVGGDFFPDIISLPHTLISEMAFQGWIASIEDFGSFDIMPTALSAFNVMGDFYGIPFAAQTDLLFFNPEAFPKGVAPHALWESPEYFSLAFDYRSLYHSLPFITGLGGYVVGFDNFGDLNFYDIGLNSQPASEGLSLMAKILNPEIVGGDDLAIFQSFIDGSSNILIAPSRHLASLREAMPDVGVQNLPNFVENIIPYTYMKMDTYQLTAQSRHHALGIEYLRFLLSEDIVAQRYHLTGALTPLNTDRTPDATEHYDVLRRQLHRSQPLPNQVEFTYLYAPYRSAADRIVQRPQRILATMDELLDEINSGSGGRSRLRQ